MLIQPVALIVLVLSSKWRLRFVWFSKRRFLSRKTGVFKSNTEMQARLYTCLHSLWRLTFAGLLMKKVSNNLLCPPETFPVRQMSQKLNSIPYQSQKSVSPLCRSTSYSPVVEAKCNLVVSRMILSLSFHWQYLMIARLQGQQISTEPDHLTILLQFEQTRHLKKSCFDVGCWFTRFRGVFITLMEI